MFTFGGKHAIDTTLLQRAHQLPAGSVVGRVNSVELGAFCDRAADGVNFGRRAAAHILEHGRDIPGGLARHILCRADGVAERQMHMLGGGDLGSFTRQRCHHLAHDRARQQLTVRDAQQSGQRVDGGVDDQFAPDERLGIVHDLQIEIG